MSVHSGPDISTDGLVLCLDAGNPKSYPGSGNTWFDLSGNGRNGTIIPRTTGFQYKTENLGILYFPDQPPATTGQYAYVTTQIPTGALSYTIHCIFRTERSTGERHVFRTNENFGCDVNGDRLRFYMTGFSVEQALTAVGTFLPNTWYHLTMVYDRENRIQSIYRNGILLGSRSHTVQYNIGTATQTWFSRSDNFIDGLAGDGGVIQFYNRVLTNSEIQQNFNATRGRYGI